MQALARWRERVMRGHYCAVETGTSARMVAGIAVGKGIQPYSGSCGFCINVWSWRDRRFPRLMPRDVARPHGQSRLRIYDGEATTAAVVAKGEEIIQTRLKSVFRWRGTQW